MTRRRLDPGEVRGHFCPACGRAAGIRRERREQPYSSGDLALAAFLGPIYAAFAATSHTRIRLRCTACRCQFPEPLGLIPASLIWLILTCAAVLTVHVVKDDAAITAAIAILAIFLTIIAAATTWSRRRRRFEGWKSRYAEDLARAGSR